MARLERQNDARLGHTSPERLRALPEGAAVPSKIVESRFKFLARGILKNTAVKPSAEVIAELKLSTLLSEETITHLFDKFSGELKLASGRAGDDASAADVLASLNDDMPDASAYEASRSSLLFHFARQDKELQDRRGV